VTSTEVTSVFKISRYSIVPKLCKLVQVSKRYGHLNTAVLLDFASKKLSCWCYR